LNQNPLRKQGADGACPLHHWCWHCVKGGTVNGLLLAVRMCGEHAFA